MMQVRRAMLAQRQVLGAAPMRCFAAHADHHEEAPGKASGRMTGNPGFYNKRFEPSSSIDGNYIDFNAYVRGASGFEPKQTNRDPSKFEYSNNIFKNDYWEWRMRLSDYLYQIGCRLHRSNDAWTRCLVGYTAFSFMMIP